MNLSIKNVPEPVVRRLRERAKRNHRSLQGELLHIIEAAAREDPDDDLTMLRHEIRGLGLTHGREATDMIRTDRDGR